MPEVVLRPAEEEDIAEMLALYAPYVVQTTVSSEYDAPSMEEFTRRWRTYTQSCRGWSAALTARSSAMAMLRRTVPAPPISGRSKHLSTLHRSSTATVSPVRFTPRCLNCWRCRGYYNIYVGITSPNERSMKFHKAMGFIISGAYQRDMYKIRSVARCPLDGQEPASA